MKKFLIGAVLGLIIGFSGSAFAAIGDRVELIISDFTIYADGVKLEIREEILNRNGTLYLPLRATTNALGREVVYHPETRSVELNTPARDPELLDSEAMPQEGASADGPVDNSEVITTTFEGMRALQVGDRVYFNLQDYGVKWKEGLAAAGSKLYQGDALKEPDYAKVLASLAGLQEDHPDLIYIWEGGGYFNAAHYQDPAQIQKREPSPDMKAFMEEQLKKQR